MVKKEVKEWVRVRTDIFEDYGMERDRVLPINEFKAFLIKVYPRIGDVQAAVDNFIEEMNLQPLTHQDAKEILDQVEGKVHKNPVVQQKAEASEEVLKDPNLFRVLDKELSKKIVKEQNSRKTVLLICLGGMLVTNASPTSTNLMVNDNAGAGKDHLVKAVLALLPKDRIINRKRISEKVFTYWHNAKFEPDWTWDGKIFYNEDISNQILNSDVFKVMSSSDGCNESTVIINQLPVEILTKGKPVMIITTATGNPIPELMRRYPIVNLNTSKDQTTEILNRKALYHEKGNVPEYNPEIMMALKQLRPVRVKVPYAKKLTDLLDHSNIIMRTHFDRLCDYIKFSAAIHQFQRTWEDKNTIFAEPEDYEIGKIALQKTTTNVFSIPLTKNRQRLLAIMHTFRPDEWKAVCDLEPKVTFMNQKSLYSNLNELTELEFLEKEMHSRGSPKLVGVYKARTVAKMEFPKFAEIASIQKGIVTTYNTNYNKSKKNIEDSRDNPDNFQQLYPELDVSEVPSEKLQYPTTPTITTTTTIPTKRIIKLLDKRISNFTDICRDNPDTKPEILRKCIEDLRKKGDIYEIKPDLWGLLK